MKPKKVVLLVDGDEDALSLRTFILENRGFRVFAAGSREVALSLLAARPAGSVHVAAVRVSGHGAEDLTFLQELRNQHPDVHVLLLRDSAGDWDRLADVCLHARHLPLRELIETVTTLAARKRGPWGSRLARFDGQKAVAA